MSYCFSSVGAWWCGHCKQSNIYIASRRCKVNISVTLESLDALRFQNTDLHRITTLCVDFTEGVHVFASTLSCQVKIINAAGEISRQQPKEEESGQSCSAKRLPPASQRWSISRLLRGYFRTREWSSALAGCGQIYTRL